MLSNIGQDTICYLSKRCNILFIVVHMSNDTKLFNSQLVVLKDFCDTHPDKTIVIIGDYNAIPKQSICSSNVLKFYSKDFELHELTDDNFQATVCFDNRNVYVGEIDTPTTCKERVITVQIIKFLKKVSNIIDGIIIIDPVATKTISNIQSGVKIFGKDIEGKCIAPIEWPSDHYVAHSAFEHLFSEHETNQIKVGSWNVFGESVNKKVYNIFEMASKYVIDKLNSDSKFETAFLRIVQSQPDINGKTFKELYESKVFSNELRSFNLFNVHCPPSFMNKRLIKCELLTELQDKYDGEYQNMISTATEQQLVYANAILNMWNEFYADPVLCDLFVGWFNDIASFPKFEFNQVVMDYLKNHIFDVFGLQEINASMLQKLRDLESEIKQYGYVLIAPSEISTKTCGVLIVANHML